MPDMKKVVWFALMFCFVFAGACNLLLVLAGVATLWTMLMLTIDVAGIIFLIWLKREGKVV